MMCTPYVQVTLRAAEQLLSDKLNARVEMRLTKTFRGEGERFLVVRCEIIQGPSEAPDSVILKRAPAGQLIPEAPIELTDLLLNEWATLRFLKSIPATAPVIPALYCGSRDAGLIVMEDLGDVDSLVQPLLGSDPQDAENALVTLAQHLGQMHAATIGRSGEFDSILNELTDGPAPLRVDLGGFVRQALGGLRQTLDDVGVAPHRLFYDEIEEVIGAVVDPGPFYVFIHGDPCPDNFLRTQSGLWFTDFEMSAFRHALLDGVYGRMMFPGCWCASRIPEATVLRMESTYRAELARGCSAAKDDRLFQRGIVDACAFWVLEALLRYLKRAISEDFDWGISSVRQRITARLRAFLDICEGHEHLQGVRHTFNLLHSRIETTWPTESKELPLYPAFGQRPC